jgi:hypothetical protein
LVQNRGGCEDQTGGILKYFKDLSQAPNKEFGPKDFFEMASKLIALQNAFFRYWLFSNPPEADYNRND